MKNSFSKKIIERYSRQIILKDVGIIGQKAISRSKVLIVGLGGLGCPVADYLSRAGIGTLGLVDFDKVNLSNIHRQTLYDSKDVGKFKVDIIKKKITNKNFDKIIKGFDIIVDGSDNFKTKFLINKFSLKYNKILIVGAISKFDGHVFTFDFKNKNDPCLKCFYQTEPSDDILNCEYEGILGPVAGVVGNIQAIEVLKKILKIGDKSSKKILILDLSKLDFRRVEFKKKINCICKK